MRSDLFEISKFIHFFFFSFFSSQNFTSLCSPKPPGFNKKLHFFYVTILSDFSFLFSLTKLFYSEPNCQTVIAIGDSWWVLLSKRHWPPYTRRHQGPRIMDLLCQTHHFVPNCSPVVHIFRSNQYKRVLFLFRIP